MDASSDDDADVDDDVNESQQIENIHVLWLWIQIPCDSVCEQTLAEKRRTEQ